MKWAKWMPSAAATTSTTTTTLTSSGSRIRKIANKRVDFPLPVLPTTPTLVPPGMNAVKCFNTYNNNNKKKQHVSTAN